MDAGDASGVLVSRARVAVGEALRFSLGNNRFIGSSSTLVHHADERELIRTRLESGRPAPLGSAVTGDVRVFVSGHTHAPSLTRFDRPAGHEGAQVNSGCWLRQLQPIPGRLGVPPVFVSRFVQTHVRVYRESGAIQVELWEHPRPSRQQLRIAERIAVAGRLPGEPDRDAFPRVAVRASIEQA